MKITKSQLKQIIKEELEMASGEKNIMDKLADMQDKGEKSRAQLIIDTARTILSYAHMKDKAMVDELIDFNKKQFGSDAGAFPPEDSAELDSAELELDL